MPDSNNALRLFLDKYRISKTKTAKQEGIYKRFSTVFNSLKDDIKRDIANHTQISYLHNKLAKGALVCTGYFFKDIEKSTDKTKVIIEESNDYERSGNIVHAVILKEIVVRIKDNKDKESREYLKQKNLIDESGYLKKIIKKSDYDNAAWDNLIKIGCIEGLDNDYAAVNNDPTHIVNFNNFRKNKEKNKETGYDSDAIIKTIASTQYQKYYSEYLEYLEDLSKESILQTIYNLDNHYCHYCDPNHKQVIIEIDWKYFAKSIEHDYFDMFKTKSSLMYKDNKSILQQKGSTCFLIAIASMAENKQELVDAIRSIEEYENTKDRTYKKQKIELIKNGKDSQTAEEKAKSFYQNQLIDQNNNLKLINIFNSWGGELVKELLSSLEEKVKAEVDNSYKEREENLTVYTIFALKKYIESDNETIITKESLKNLFNDEEKKKIISNKSQEFLDAEVENLQTQLSEKLKIPKVVIKSLVKLPEENIVSQFILNTLKEKDLSIKGAEEGGQDDLFVQQNTAEGLQRSFEARNEKDSQASQLLQDAVKNIIMKENILDEAVAKEGKKEDIRLPLPLPEIPAIESFDVNERIRSLKTAVTDLRLQGVRENIDAVINDYSFENREKESDLIRNLLHRAIEAEPSMEPWMVTCKEQERIDIASIIIEKSKDFDLNKPFVIKGGAETVSIPDKLRQKIDNFTDAKADASSKTKKESLKKIHDLLEDYKNKDKAIPSNSLRATNYGNEGLSLGGRG